MRGFSEDLCAALSWMTRSGDRGAEKFSARILDVTEALGEDSGKLINEDRPGT